MREWSPSPSPNRPDDDSDALPRPRPRGRQATERINALAAVDSDGRSFVRTKLRGGKLDDALHELDDFAETADVILGHNLIHFDLPHLRAAAPGLRLLGRPALDTLMLSPLAFPRNTRASNARRSGGLRPQWHSNRRSWIACGNWRRISKGRRSLRCCICGLSPRRSRTMATKARCRSLSHVTHVTLPLVVVVVQAFGLVYASGVAGRSGLRTGANEAHRLGAPAAYWSGR